MSAASSIGSSSASLYMQQMQAARNDNDADDVKGAGGPGGPRGARGLDNPRFKAAFEAAAKSAGADDATLATIEKQIADAKQAAQQSGSTDTRASMKDTINNILKNNGVDVTKFEAAMQASRPQGHHGHRKAQSSTTNSTSVQVDPATVQKGQTVGTLVDVAA